MSLNHPDFPNKARIAENVRAVQERMESACARVGRSADEVKLVAVTKYARMEWVWELLELGLIDLGESRPQQLVERASLLDQNIRWHLIGNLQRNKARRMLPLVGMIHSVDTLRLLDSLERLAGELELRPHLLLEVNISGEEAKHGFAPRDLIENWGKIIAFKHLSVDGLMTMAPFTEEVEETRGVFRDLRALRDKLVAISPESVSLPELSMGMSRDFEVAIEEGATMVRIGSILFEGLESDDQP